MTLGSDQRLCELAKGEARQTFKFQEHIGDLKASVGLFIWTGASSEVLASESAYSSFTRAARENVHGNRTVWKTTSRIAEVIYDVVNSWRH